MSKYLDNQNNNGNGGGDDGNGGGNGGVKGVNPDLNNNGNGGGDDGNGGGNGGGDDGNTGDSQQNQAAARLAAAGQKRVNGWDDILASLDGNLADIEEQEKRERRNRLFYAIGDGLSALSNIYFTTKGAPSMFDGKNTMSAASQARIDKLRAEREKYLKWMHASSMKRDDTEYEVAKEAYGRERQKEMDEDARKIAAAKDARDEARLAIQQERLAMQQEKQFWQNLLAAGKATYQEYKNEMAEIDAKYHDRLVAAGIAQKNRSNANGGGRAGEYPWYDSDGNLHYAHSYEAMRQNAILNDTWNEATQESTTVRNNGRRTSTTTMTKPGRGSSSKPSGKKGSLLPGNDKGSLLPK